jgi:hypothetical protein
MKGALIDTTGSRTDGSGRIRVLGIDGGLAAPCGRAPA